MLFTNRFIFFTSFYYLLILVSGFFIFPVQTLAVSIDTTAGEKKLVEGQTIWSVSIYYPYTITFSFVYDSIDSYNQLKITHVFTTPTEKYTHPMVIDTIQKGDKITLFGKNIQILNWDPWYVWIEYLNSDSSTYRNPQSVKIEDKMIDSAYFVAEISKVTSMVTDTSQIKELILAKSQKHYLFQNLNEAYKKTLWLLSTENYQDAFTELNTLLEKKDVPFFGLVYFAGLSALRLERFDPAIQYFQRLQDMVPQNPLGLYGISLAYYKKKEYSAAESFIKRVVKTYPKWEQGYLLYAWILSAQGVPERQITNEIKKSNLYRDSWNNTTQFYPPLDIYCFDIEDLNNRK